MFVSYYLLAILATVSALAIPQPDAQFSVSRELAKRGCTYSHGKAFYCFEPGGGSGGDGGKGGRSRGKKEKPKRTPFTGQVVSIPGAFPDLHQPSTVYGHIDNLASNARLFEVTYYIEPHTLQVTVIFRNSSDTDAYLSNFEIGVTPYYSQNNYPTWRADERARIRYNGDSVTITLSTQDSHTLYNDQTTLYFRCRADPPADS